jgi:hypothetical protein
MNRRTWLWAVLLGYATIVVIMTWPAAGHLSTHMVGTGDDMWVHYWNNWWVQDRLSSGRSIISTRLLFYPQTVSLVYHNFGWLNIGGWLLLEPIVGGIAAYNLVFLANLTLCAFAMFVLARHVVGSNGPAFVAGLVYGCWPYRLTEYNHPNLVSTQWIPLALLCVILLVRERQRIRHVLLAGLLLALTGLARWQLLLPAGIAIGIYLLCSLLWERERWSWRVFGWLALAALLAAALMAIPIYPLAQGVAQGRMGEFHYPLEETWAEKTQTDLLAYVIPPANHPLAPLFSGLGYTHRAVRPYGYVPSAFVGYTILALALLAAIWRWKHARPWVALALLALLLALGPVLRFNGKRYPAVPMPYRLVGWMAPFEWMRTPRRFNLLLDLPVAILAGYGTTVLHDWLSPRRPVLLWGGLSALVLFDCLSIPAMTVQASVPDFYFSIAPEQEPGDFAIVVLPGDRQSAEFHMYYQTVHRRPMLTGHISRVPPNALDFVTAVPMLDGIYESGQVNTDVPDLSRQLSLLADAGFRYIVIDKNLAPPDKVAEWRSYLVASPAYEDHETLVYSTTPAVGSDASIIASLGAGVALLQASLSTESISPPDARVELEVTWGTITPPGSRLEAEITLTNPEGERVWTQRFDIMPTWPTDDWPANAIAHDMYAFEIEPWWGSDTYAVRVQLINREDDRPVGQPVKVGEFAIEIPERTFTAPPMACRTDVAFGDSLQLLGYDLEVGEHQVCAILHYQALRRMEANYKFFVHLYDTQSGALVAQTDVMPRNWTYPTRWWENGEVVSDPIVVQLDGVPSGRYRVGVGVYDPQLGERLPIASDVPPGFDADSGCLLFPQTIERIQTSQ